MLANVLEYRARSHEVNAERYNTIPAAVRDFHHARLGNVTSSVLERCKLPFFFLPASYIGIYETDDDDLYRT